MLEMGIFGVWIAMFAEWTVRSVIFLLRLRGTKWYSHVSFKT
jgi:Na+-driven multidrug efflux pump